MPPSGHELRCGPLSVEYTTKRVVRDAELVEIVEQRADVLVVIDHRVVVRRLPASGLSQALLLGVREQVHVREVHPHEERLVGVNGLLDESLGLLGKVVVAGQHPLCVERPGVLDLLLADLAPSRLHGLVVDVGGEAVDDAARLDRLDEVAEFFLREVVVHLRLFLGVEVVEIAVELVEPVVVGSM